jgi:hypothetical protein
MEFEEKRRRRNRLLQLEATAQCSPAVLWWQRMPTVQFTGCPAAVTSGSLSAARSRLWLSPLQRGTLAECMKPWCHINEV